MEWTNKWEKVYRIVTKILIVSAIVFALFFVEHFTVIFLENNYGLQVSDYDWYDTVLPIYNKVVGVTLLIVCFSLLIFLALLLVRVLLKKNSKVIDHFPFQSLNEVQIIAIEKLFRELPSHKDKEDEINMKDVARYLTALVELGYISPSMSAHKNELRDWVIKVTGKSAPEQFRFNQAYPSTNKNGINEAIEIIEKCLKSL